MAVDAELTRQMPFVGTDDQYDLIDILAKSGVSKAFATRWAINRAFGLTERGGNAKGWVPTGKTLEEVAAAALTSMGRGALEAAEEEDVLPEENVPA
jgi:hypothetical protein